MSKWVLTRKGGDFQSIGKKFNISPILARLIRNKDIITDKEISNYLSPEGVDFYSPWLLKDIIFAVELIKESIKDNAKIRIVGDYDIDGVNASYILWKGLNFVGAICDVQIPNRVQDGYGINLSIVQKAIDDNIDLIITCDNGIAAFEAIEFAVHHNIKVIITDHHEVRQVEGRDGMVDEIPNATFVINPKQKSCPYPFSGICGATVAYKLISALFESLELEDSPLLGDLLENAAIATIGDVMSLVDENRSIVKKGLKHLRNTKNEGLIALASANQIDIKSIDTYHIGFRLGPCINAPGRLETANQSLTLLMAETKERAKELALSLVEINEERKKQTLEATEIALKQLESLEKLPDVIVLYLPTCHESIAGIVAGRIKELTMHPTFVITNTDDGSLKGSGRSIAGYSMFDKMSEIGDIFSKFGGHPMAAGLSLPFDKLEEFSSRINEHSELKEEDFNAKLVIDMPLPFKYVNLSLIEELKKLEPFGNGNSKPIFGLTNVIIKNLRFLGDQRNVLKIDLIDQHHFKMDGIMFIDQERLEEMLANNYSKDEIQGLIQGDELEVAIAFYPKINEYMDRKYIQIEIKEIG